MSKAKKHTETEAEVISFMGLNGAGHYEPQFIDFARRCYRIINQLRGEVRVKTEILEDAGLGSLIVKRTEDFKQLKKVLNKAEFALLQWNPADMFFPEIELQFAELIDEIHNALKGGPAAHEKRDLAKITSDLIEENRNQNEAQGGQKGKT